MKVVIVGAGHNGLIAAFYLARAGLKPVVVEQRHVLGGGAVTGELHPGFTCPTLTHHASIREGIATDMQLSRHGLEWLRPAVDVFIPDPGGTAVTVYGDDERAVEHLRGIDARGADAMRRYRTALSAMASMIDPLLAAPPPDIDQPDRHDIWNLLNVGRRFRALGKHDAYRLLRWAPMPIADFASEWFESPLLRAAICGSGISGTMLGPRSAGSTLVHLLRETHRRAGGGGRQVRGGPGALTEALAAAARNAGAEIRTAARVDCVGVEHGRVTSLTINGAETQADAVVSAIDPRTTFLKLLDPLALSPDVLSKIGHYRSIGTVAKVNLALSALPGFGAANAELLSGRIQIGADVDTLERAFDHAKYGEVSEEPWLDVAIPSILDPSLVPPGSHVMSIYVHCVPYQLRGGDWSAAREVILSRTLAVLDRYASGMSRLVIAAQVLTPKDLEAEYGFSGGHIFHGELSLDQLFTMRPLLGYARYRSPIGGLYVCSGGTHPGGFMSGVSGRLAAERVLADRRD